MKFNNLVIDGTYFQNFGKSGNEFLYVYSGEMPEVNENFMFNAADFSSQRLATFQLTATQLSGGSVGILALAGAPTTVTVPASATGTATWFAMVDGGQLNSAIIGTLTDNVEKSDVLLLESVNLVQGQPAIVIDFRINLLGEV